MWIPFSKKINSVFEAEHGLPAKLVGGGFIGLLIGIKISASLVLNEKPFQPGSIIPVVLTCAASILFCELLILFFACRDVAKRKLENSEALSWPARFLFTGATSIMIASLVLSAAVIGLLITFLPN